MSNDYSAWPQSQRGYAPPPPQQDPRLVFGPMHDDPPRKVQRRGGVPGWVVFIIAVASGVVGFVAGAAATSTSTTTTAAVPSSPKPKAPAATPVAPKAATTKAAAPAAPAAPKPITIDDGTWVVGEDVPAGTYKVAAAVSSDCYWGVMKSGTNGADIIDNDIPGGGRPKVTIKRGQDFVTRSCGTWVKVG